MSFGFVYESLGSPGLLRKSISQNHNLQTLLCLTLCAPYQKLHEILPLAGIWRVLSSPTVSQVI